MKKVNIKTKYLKPFKNIYILIMVIFVVWMVFFDSNSWFIHNELNEDIEDLISEKDYYRKEIEKDRNALKALGAADGLEKFAREEYYMKKENEDIFIIEYEDSLKAQTRE